MYYKIHVVTIMHDLTLTERIKLFCSFDKIKNVIVDVLVL